MIDSYKAAHYLVKPLAALDDNGVEFDNEIDALNHALTAKSYDHTYGIWVYPDSLAPELLCIVHEGTAFWE